MPHERRVFADLPQGILAPVVGDQLQLSAADSHHLLTVLRLQTGSAVVVALRPSGAEFEAVLVNESSPLAVRLVRPHAGRGGASIVRSLSFAVTKGGTTDLVCEKAAELGVREIVFWQAARSVVKVGSADDRKKKMERWRRISESAARQSLKPFVPEIRCLSGIHELLQALNEMSAPNDAQLCCSLAREAVLLRTIAPPRGAVHLVVGPEGDFTPDEEEALIAGGCRPVSLGASVLRSETAAIASVAMVEALWGGGSIDDCAEPPAR